MPYNHLLPKKNVRTESEDTESNRAKTSKVSSLWLRISAFLSLKAPNTQRTYLGIINEWCTFLGGEAGSELAARKILKATDLEAIAYKGWLEKRLGQKPRYATSASSSRALNKKQRFAPKRDGLQYTLANATIAKKFAALKRMYRMLIASKFDIHENPFDTDKVATPSAQSGQKRPTEMLDFKVVKKIIDLPDSKTPKGLRDRTILSTLFGGGLRRSELVALRLGDVQKTPKGTVYLRLRSTKAKRDADQALPSWAAQDIGRLLESRRESGAQDGDYLFISYRGKGGHTPTNEALSDSGLYKLFKTYCLLAGATKFATPHSARATAITKLLSEGISHREIQEFSRHASVQMVEVYDKRRIGVDENPAKDLEFT